MAVSVFVSGSSTAEGTTSSDPNYLQFAITLSEAATQAVTVQYRLWSGTAQAGSDVYDYGSGASVTFAAGETSKTVYWRIDADSEVETDEAVVLEVYSVKGGGAALAGNASLLRATGWVLDDDGTGNKLALFTSEPLVVEGDAGTKQANFEVSLSRPAPEAFTVSYTTVDGSAHAGQDYAATSGTLSFVAGQTSASVSVPIIGDTVSEPSDNFALAFTAPAIVTQTTLGEATILDDDAASVVVSVAGATNFEGTTSSDPNYLQFAITLSEAATENVTVQYRLWSGTAQAGSDVYDYGSGASVTFAAGETSKTVFWRIDADSEVETDEAVVLEVYSVKGGGAALAGNASLLRATGWVLDDDGTGNKLALFTSQPLVVEGDAGTKQANFEVSLSRPAPEAFTVSYTTVDGSAHAGQDYTATSGTLSFVAGQTSASVSVPIIGDTVSEPSDNFALAFTAPAIVTQTTLGEATILDDDAASVVVSVAGASNFEGTTSSDPNYLQFAITLSEAASGPITVGYRLLSGTASAGFDVYDYGSGTSVTFAAGETSKTVAWRIDADSEAESDEAVVLEVYGVSGGAALAGNASVLRTTGWVLDDDGTGNKLALYASRPVMVEGDSGTRQVNFDISLSRPATEAFSVAYATADGSAHAGQDYVATSGTLSFVKGQTSSSVSVEVIGDAISEPSDQFVLAFEAPTQISATSIGEALILDDDAGAIVVSVTGGSNYESTTSSDPNYLLFGITLSEPATGPVTVGYRLLSGTATAGSDVYDYGSGVSVTFAAGETSKTVAWRIDADSDAEADEAVVLEVYSVSGGANLAGNASVLRATGWVLDDDGTGNKLAVFTSNPVLSEGDGVERQANFEVSLSRPAPGPIDIAFHTVDVTGHAGADYVATSGTLHFVTGQTQASVSVPVIGDTVVESSDVFLLAFDKPAEVVSASIGEALLLDDDAGTPTVSLTGASNFEGTTSSDPSYLSFGITLSAPSAAPVTVNYRLLSGTATADSDVYNYGSGGSVTFAAGETSKTVSWRIDADSVDEVDEAVVMELTSVTGNARFADGVSALRATGWVLDDDGAGSNLALFAESSQVVEGVAGYDREATAIVRLSRPSDTAIDLAYTTVAGSATAGSDFTPTTGTLHFDPLQTVAAVQVAVTGDADNEVDETLTVQFTPPAELPGGTAGATSTITILDGDRLPPPAPLAIEAGDAVRFNEGATLLRSVVLSDGQDNGAVGYDYTIDYGDGTLTNGHTDTLALTLSHTYADGPANHTVKVTVKDGIGETATDSFAVTVNNVAPTLQASGAAGAAVGQPYTLTLSNLIDPGVDTLATDGILVNWGDGTSTRTGGVGELTHTYAKTGNYTVRTSLSDEDGSYNNVASLAVAVENRQTISTTLTLPASLAPGETGVGTLNYTSIVPESQDGVLVLVSSKASLLKDPLTGEYSDTLLLVGRGDGVGAITSGETGALPFTVKMANSPNARADVSVSVITPTTAIDFAGLSTALRSEFTTDAAWQRIYGNFLSDIGGTTAGLISALADNSRALQDLGVESRSGLAALSYELEQASDFGSLQERATTGSLGQGWAFIGDVKLDVSASGDVAWRGSTNLDALVSLSARAAAQYAVSSSVGVTVGLDGTVLNGAPADRPVFTKNIDGSFSTSSTFDGDLVKTASGYELHTSAGGVLRFGADGQLLEVVTSTGQTTQVTHDAQGRITGFSAGLNNTLTIQWDADGHAAALVDEHGQTTTLSYGGGQLVGQSNADGSASFGYDAKGDLATVTPAGGPATAFAYDDHGRLAGVEVAGVQAATVSYDSRGGYTLSSAEGQQLAVELAPGGVAAEVQVGGTTASKLIYDASGKPTGMQLADGSELKFAVDDQGRLLSITDPTGATVSYAYEGDSTRPSSFTDAGGSTRQFSYDADGRLDQATWTDGSALQFDYDAQGQITGFTNRRGDATTYQYDAKGQLVARTEADGRTSYAYDSLGRMVTATTGAGTAAEHKTEIGYDSANRVTHIEYPDGRSLDYAYDAAGHRTAMTDQEGNVQGYTYDAAGRLATVAYNGSQLVSYTYDGEGRLVDEANGNGTHTLYTYDARGLLSAIVNEAPDGTESSAYRYTYDAAGQRVGQETPHGTWAYGYDGSGQLTSANLTVNAAGVAAGLTDKSLVYAYDAAGNRTSVVEDGVKTDYSSNALNQYTQVGNATYTYDADGNQTSKTVNGETWSYGYNEANRLEQITAPDGAVTQYEYDVFGSRAAVIENGVRTEFLVDPFALGMGSPVAEYSGGERVASYLYGLNAIAQQTSTGTYFFDGDAVGSVTGLTGANGSLANAYAYDPFGRQLVEAETVANRLEFNGLFGVEALQGGQSYMRARFYDAGLGRFEAEDPLWLNGDIGNLYRFVSNNPVQLVDPSGLLSASEFEIYRDQLNGYALAGTIGAGVVIIVAGGPVLATLATGAAVYGAYSVVSNLATAGYGWYNGNDKLLWDGVENLAWDVAGAGVGKYIKAAVEVKRAAEWDFLMSRGFFKFDSGDGHYLRFDSWRNGFDQAWNLIGTKAELSGVGAIEALKAIWAYTTGDPHLRTFDGLSYDFQGAGEFVLAHGNGLEIQTRQEPWGNSKFVTINTAVAMRVGDAVVGLYLGEPNSLNINGQFVALADGDTISVGGGSIYRKGASYVITNATGDGVVASINGNYINAQAFIGDDRRSDVSGLLGNHDGNTSNDLALADGTVLPNPVPLTQLYSQFADSWRVTPDTSLFIYGPGESTATYTDRRFPGNIVTLADLDPAVRAAAELIAKNAGLVPGTWAFDSAVLDIALTNDAAFAGGGANVPDTTAPEPTPVQLQRPPLVVADSAATQEDTAVTILALANDSDPEGDPLQIVGATANGQGQVSVVNGQQLVFTPGLNFNGVANLGYTVSDGAGNLVAGVVKVEVQAVNDAATAVSDKYTATQGQSLSITAANGVLKNDADVDGDAFTVVGHGNASHGSITVGADGALVYTPFAGFVGTENIEYTISDGKGETDTDVLRIDVAAAATEKLHVGDAPVRQTGTGGQWATAWTNDVVDIAHKANHANANEAWTAVKLHGVSPQSLAGGDIYSGDLGVSGQSAATSSVRQEVDGTEALRFNLDRGAIGVSLKVSNFFLNDDGSLYSEAGVLRLLGSDGKVVAEQAFTASNADGTARVQVNAMHEFSAVEVLVGAYSGDQFHYGAYATAEGQFAKDVYADAAQRLHGSDLLVDDVEFTFLPGVAVTTALEHGLG